MNTRALDRSGPSRARRVHARWFRVRRLAPAAGLVLAAGACRANTADAAGEAGAGGAPEAEVQLSGRILTDTLQLAVPRGILQVSGSLVVYDAQNDFAVRVFDLSGRPLAAHGRQGSGPGEYVQPADLFTRPGHPDEFWTWDSRLGRLIPYRLAPGSAGRLAPAADPLRLHPGLMVEAPRWLDDSTLVGLHPMLRPGEGRFALYGADGRLRRTVGAPPPGEDRRADRFIRQQAYGGKIAVHPRQPLFVLASRYAGSLDVYDRTGARRVRCRVPTRFEPDFSPAPDGINMVRGEHFRHGYIDVAATDRHIYALYSGRPESHEAPNFARHVHVFDWNGRFLRALRLDMDVFRITVDPTERHLYAIRHDPYPQVLAFNLNGTRATERRAP